MLTATGAVLLMVVSAYHLTGIVNVAEVLGESEISENWKNTFSGLWLFFGYHLAVIALFALTAAVLKRNWLPAVTTFCAVATLCDFIWVYLLAGWFPGTYLLLLIVVLFSAGAYLAGRSLPVSES
jgi:hypothetical protein